MNGFGKRPSFDPPGWAYPTAACAALIACIVAGHTFADSAFNDDWSYTYTALKFAETGRIQYNGWGISTALFQSIWALPWIRMWGFSFDIMRLVTIPFSVGFLALTYAIGRKAGLTRVLALFGALVVGTSPLFVPLAASFMTEPYACLFTALCIYAAIRSAEAASLKTSTLWMWVLAISGILGGSDRQSVWIAPLFLIPYLCWVRKFERRFLMHQIPAYFFCVALLVFLGHRFTQVNGSLALSKTTLLSLLVQHFFSMMAKVFSLVLTCGLVALPALLCFSPDWKKISAEKMIGILAGAGAITFLLAASVGIFGVAPYGGTILTPFGILWANSDALGFRPTILPIPVRLILSLLVIFAGAAFCLLKWGSRSASGGIEKGHWRQIFGIFSAAYVAALAPAALVSLTQDRYVLPLLPLAVIFLLSHLSRSRQAPSRSAWASLSMLAVYSILTTHDYYSSLRARAEAARRLQVRGVPRRVISAGFEYDGWTQLQLTGKIGSLMPENRATKSPPNEFWLWRYATEIKPEYVAVYSGDPEPTKAQEIVPFMNWLPPFRRSVVVVRREELAERVAQ